MVAVISLAWNSSVNRQTVPRRSWISKAEASYLLTLPDYVGLFVYHISCAVPIATEFLVYLYTFFRPPALSHHLFVLDPTQSANAHKKGRT
jgi:hypothetical protein